MRHILRRSVFILFAFSLLSCSEEATNVPDSVSVSGVVQKASTGDFVQDAKVTALRHTDSEELGSSVTDAEGVFLISGLPRVAMDIRVEADGYAPILFEDLDPATSLQSMNNMSVQMDTVDTCCSGVMFITVKNADGVPLKNIAVVIKRNGTVIADPRTNEQGKAVEDGLCPGDYSIRIAAEGYKVYEAVFTINSSCEPVELIAQLQPTSTGCCDGVLTVTVKDPLGAPVMGALVRVWKGGAKLHQTFTDSLGVAVFTDLCRGGYGVDVTKTGYTDREYEFEINENCDPVNKVVVVEQLACCDGVLTLVVRDKNNNPVANAKVLVRKGSKVIEDPLTDANGRIVVDGLCAGHYNYRISKDGYEVIEAEFDINESCDPVTREVTVETESEACCDGVLTLTVKDPQGQPIAGATVKLWQNGAVLKSTTTNASGVAIFSDLCKGEYGVDVMKDGWTDREFGFAINSNCDPVNKTVVMEELPCCEGVFTLIVRDGNGDPVQNATVLLRRGSKAVADPRTDANGRIVVDGLCKGEYNFRVSKEGYKVVEGVFAINENCDPVTKEVTLEQVSTECCSGILKVNAVDSTNTPVPGATVRLWKNGVVIETATTNSNGRAVFDGLCVGSYGVDVEKTGLKGREFQFAINVNCDPYVKTVELLP